MYVWEKHDFKYVVFWKRTFKHMPEHIHRQREISISGLDLLPCT